MRVSLSLISAVLLLLSGLGAQQGVAVESHRWGFDGTVRSGDYNLLTVVVRNSGAKVYDGEVSLRLITRGLSLQRGMATTKSCFLLPGQSRRIQFQVFVAESYHNYSVAIRRGARLELDHLKEGNLEGGGSIVVLESTDSMKVTSTPLPHFPENEFPVHGYTTRNLAAVVLDHVPEFTGAQRLAFLDWLRGGGRLHLYHRVDKYPEFNGDMSTLNDPRETYRVGMGSVHRNATTIAEAVSLKTLPGAAKQESNKYSYRYSHRASNILDVLRGMVRPKHHWPLIYFLLFAFFVVAVPYHYLFSQRKSSYLQSIFFLVGIVGVTSWIVYFLGARGYGEDASVHLLGYAKQLSKDRFEVRRHGNAFATTSGRYTLRFQGKGGQFDAGGAQSIDGTRNPDGSLRVAVPIFTSRPFIHVSAVDSPLVQANTRSWLSESPEDAALAGLTLSVNQEVVAGWAFHLDDATRLEPTRDGLLGAGEIQSSKNLFKTRNNRAERWRFSDSGDSPFSDVCIEQSIPMLSDLWRRGSNEVVPATLTDLNTVRVALLCKLPDELKLVDNELGEQDGYVLYDILLERPEN